MKESLDRVCRGCWAIIMASIRLILFLGTIIFMIISILLLSHTTHFANSLMVDPNKATLFSLYFYTFNGINFVAGMVGLYGIFNRNLVALKAFPNMLFATTTTLSLYIIFGFTYSSEVSLARADYLKLLNIYSELYDWNSLSSADGDDSGQKIRATRAWDAAQSEMCCGIDSYKDWDKYRPTNLASNFYPKSCCPIAHSISEDSGPFCVDDSDLYREGCAQLGASFWSSLLIYYTLFLVFELTLSTLAWFYWQQFRPGNGIVLRPPGNNWQCTPEIPISWPSSQQQQQQQQSANQLGSNFTSPIYPNINLSYQESPPSYASVATSKDTHVHKI